MFLNALNFKAISSDWPSRACLGTWLHCILQLNMMHHCSQTHFFALYIQSTLSLDLILNVVWHTPVCIYILWVWPCILGKVMKSLLDGWFMQFDITWGKINPFYIILGFFKTLVMFGMQHCLLFEMGFCLLRLVKRYAKFYMCNSVSHFQLSSQKDVVILQFYIFIYLLVCLFSCINVIACQV